MVWPICCMSLMSVEPVSSAMLSSSRQTWVSWSNSMTLPSKKSMRACPSGPVLTQSPTSSSMPSEASAHPVEPVFNTSTSPVGEERVVGRRENFCVSPQQAQKGATNRSAARMMAPLHSKPLPNMSSNPDSCFPRDPVPIKSREQFISYCLVNSQP